MAFLKDGQGEWEGARMYARDGVVVNQVRSKGWNATSDTPWVKMDEWRKRATFADCEPEGEEIPQ